jgi:hypothetical protein
VPILETEIGCFLDLIAVIQGNALTFSLTMTVLIDVFIRALLDGREEFATFEYPDGSPGCLQWDVPAAKDTIARIKIMVQDMGVHVALAHDISWMMEDSNQMLLSLLDAPLLDATRERCPLNKIL